MLKKKIVDSIFNRMEVILVAFAIVSGFLNWHSLLNYGIKY